MDKAIPTRALKLIAAAERDPIAIAASRLDRTSPLRRDTRRMAIGAVLRMVSADKKTLAANEGDYEHKLQRDTKGRAFDLRKTAYLRYEKEVLPTQHHIQLVFWEGEFQGLDGNTRMMLWGDRSQTCKVPSMVDVTFYYPKDEAEYSSLYLSIDSKQSHKTDKHLLFGIFRAVGITPVSELFKAYKVVSAIKYVANLSGDTQRSAAALQRATEAWRKPLQMLDSFGFQNTRKLTYSTGVWAALLELLAQEDIDTNLVKKFAEGLRHAREANGTNSFNPEAINTFAVAYANFKSPGVAGNVSEVAQMTLKAFHAYASSVKKATRPASPRKTPGLKLVDESKKAS